MGQGDTIRTHIFGHSLINFVHPDDPPPFPNYQSAVPYWVSEFAAEADNQYELSGQWGQLHEHRLLNVQPNWGFSNVAGAWDGDIETFDEVDFTSIIIMPSNFEQYLSPTTNFDGLDYSTVDATETVFNWCIAQEPNLNFFIYEHWTEMTSNLLIDSTGWNAYNQTITGSYNDWFIDYQDAMITLYPNSCISMIPVGPIISEILTMAPYDQIPLTEIYVDADPHGTPNLYFLAGMITYMALYEEPAPSTYVPPTYLHAMIIANYNNLIDFIWQALQGFDNNDGDSRVFCTETSTSSTDLSLDVESITLLPNPCDDKVVISGLLSGYSIDILDANGQVHQSLNTTQSQIIINTASLPAGVYFLRIWNNSNSNLHIETMIKM